MDTAARTSCNSEPETVNNPSISTRDASEVMGASPKFAETSGLRLGSVSETGESSMLEGCDEGLHQPPCVAVLTFENAIDTSAADLHESPSVHNVKEPPCVAVVAFDNAINTSAADLHESPSSALANKTLDVGVEEFGSTAALHDGLPNEVAANNHLKKEESSLVLHVEKDSEDEAKTLKGQKVRKKFGKKYISGEVVDCDPQCTLSKILYENGVEEELEVHELKPLLISAAALEAVGILSVESLPKAEKARVPNMDVNKRKAKTISRCPKTPKTHGKRRKLSTVMTKSQVMSNRKVRSKLRDLNSLMSPMAPEVKVKRKANLPRLNEKCILSKRLDSESCTRKSAHRNEKAVKKKNASTIGDDPPHLVKHEMEGIRTRKKAADVNQAGLESGIIGVLGVPSHVGKRVRKLRDGVVVKFDKAAKSYKVKYDDGDQENLEVDELEQMLVPELSSMDMESDDRPSKLSSLSLLLSREM